MTAKVNSSIRSRRVSAELRRYRMNAALSGVQVGEHLSMSPSKLSRMETGERGLKVDDVAALLGLYRVPERRRDELLDLLRKADERGLWHCQDTGLPDLWGTLLDFESRASRIQTFDLNVVPGLCQTADYAAALVHGINPAVTEGEVDNVVSARLARQLVLRSPSVQYLAVVDEGVLHRAVGDHEIGRRQLRRLVDEAARPNVTVRVVPFTAGGYTGLRGPFMLMDFEDEPSVVYMENQSLSMFMEEEADLATFYVAMGGIVERALSPADSVALISRLATEQSAG